MNLCQRILKRLMDLAGSAVGLVLASPLMLYIALRIRLESRGPAIFRQERAGRDMKPLTLYKFRTMRVDADPFGVSPTGGDDPRLTRFGRRLRETSRDELPQLWNVLRGDMSLVGPRPLYLSQAREFTDRQRRRLEVKPGLTGMAQVSGRGDLPHAEKLELDVQYVENVSLGLDLKIIWRTVVLVFRRQHVYQRW